jgi:hypothetical protein
MARAVISDPKRRSAFEPLYDIDPRTGASIEVFYADRVLAGSFGTRGAGWCWWACQPGCLPDAPPVGPFPTSYAAYRDALHACTSAPGGCGQLVGAVLLTARIPARVRAVRYLGWSKT